MRSLVSGPGIWGLELRVSGLELGGYEALAATLQGDGPLLSGGSSPKPSTLNTKPQNPRTPNPILTIHGGQEAVFQPSRMEEWIPIVSPT